MIKSIKIKRIGIRMQKRNKKEYRNRIMRILIMMTKKILKIIRKIKKTKKILIKEFRLKNKERNKKNKL
jgi:hypothetical protein